MTVICRDWTTTLWQASYMGVPFFFENTGASTLRSGSRVAARQVFHGTAYLIGENADDMAVTLENAVDSKRPCVLLGAPFLGVISAWCSDAKRCIEKDKLGCAAVSIKFLSSRANVARVLRLGGDIS